MGICINHRAHINYSTKFSSLNTSLCSFLFSLSPRDDALGAAGRRGGGAAGAGALVGGAGGAGRQPGGRTGQGPAGASRRTQEEQSAWRSRHPPVAGGDVGAGAGRRR